MYGGGGGGGGVRHVGEETWEERDFLRERLLFSPDGGGCLMSRGLVAASMAEMRMDGSKCWMCDATKRPRSPTSRGAAA